MNKRLIRNNCSKYLKPYFRNIVNTLNYRNAANRNKHAFQLLVVPFESIIHSSIFRFIRVSFHLIPVFFPPHSSCHSGIFWFIPVYSVPFHSVPVFSNAPLPPCICLTKQRHLSSAYIQATLICIIVTIIISINSKFFCRSFMEILGETTLSSIILRRLS